MDNRKIQERLIFKTLPISHWIGKLIRDELPGRPTHDKISLKEFIRNPFTDPYYRDGPDGARDYLMGYAKYGLGEIMSD